ncbi:Os08g0484666 [Oryza sativa Japonica Group]|uniref:Os08g0484666 protein n=1 Tax=Oryza sativa subsp. japonica TaxID=39947 RepID=A0A0N7KQ16_ORYSJ|nr:Os08g0484666 [Oryza sativa Japonica Group]
MTATELCARDVAAVATRGEKPPTANPCMREARSCTRRQIRARVSTVTARDNEDYGGDDSGGEERGEASDNESVRKEGSVTTARR